VIVRSEGGDQEDRDLQGLQAAEAEVDQNQNLQEAKEIGQGFIALNKNLIFLLKPFLIFLQGTEEIIYFLINVLKV